MPQIGLSLPVFVLVFVECALTAAGHNRVWVVSQANGPFFDIQPAIDAASDRDTVLVKAGTYAGFTIDDKDLNVVADTNATVLVTSLVQVKNLSADKDVVLVGLTVAPTGSAGPDALDVENDRGSVRVESCAIVANSDDVAITFSHITSGPADYFRVGCAGLLASHSNVAVYDGESHGGSGAFGCPTGYDGGAGVDLQFSFLYASRCRSYGGTGGPGNSGGIGCACGADGGSGGAGLRLMNGSAARLVAGRFVGGAGGQRDCGGCGGCGGSDGVPGPSIQGGATTTTAGDGPMLEVPNPIRELAVFPVTVEGRPGDRVYLYMSQGTAFRYLPNGQGVLLTQQPQPKIFLGTIGASGILSKTFSFPDLGPGIDAQNEFLQAAVKSSTGSWILSDLSSLVLLDRSF